MSIRIRARVGGCHEGLLGAIDLYGGRGPGRGCCSLGPGGEPAADSYPSPHAGGPTGGDGWAVGASDGYGTGSVILHTSDAGATWVPQASNLSGELSNVDFVDAQNGWAISDEDFGYGATGAPLTVEHTTDGGATWVPQHVYDNADLSGVDFISDTTGWVSVLRRFVERASGVDPGDELPYDYLRFKCTLKPGEYRVVVRALDVAGNPQCLIGHGVLKVVRHGAPVFRGPGWPAGLATDYSDYAARLSHDPQARRLLRLRVSLPDGRRMLLTSLAGKLR